MLNSYICSCKTPSSPVLNNKKRNMETLVHIEELTKRFSLSRKQRKLERTRQRHKTAVDHLSFDACRGEIFGLLGPNGAGKTTTLRMLATLIRPDSGDAWIDGCSIVRQPAEVRRRIGFLTSELKLEDFFTPDYLYDFFSNLHQVEPSEAQRRKAEMFSRFGIDRFAGVKVQNLSSGMKQKTSLAISLVHNPDIIIFDEPTNGLDVLTARTVTDYLLELKAQGKTILLSTHIFSIVEKLCDRVGIVIDGRMAGCGTLSEICDGLTLEDRFFEIYKTVKGGDQ
ncbi:MAG: ABC-type multidrug transport system, ATPase component [bacterium P3]|mgnify:CR=1 FL=1|nr:MAG: ABC-type multidrug transport system, ATPase component [bacterium P3]KWW40135.1 MAG: ABC-type multidrug transport system, ATPase component [bacterium F083]